MWLSKLVVWIVIYGILGWVFESVYCTVVEGRWENRGFLYGPLCPIYGVGATLMLLAWDNVLASGANPEPWQVFVVAALGSAALEYLTSLSLEALFHARWWDYANMPFNLNGRICLPATVLFGFAGLLVAYVLYQPTMDVTNAVPPALLEALSLVLACVVSVDATLTVSALTRFAQIAQDVSNTTNEHMERLVNDAMGQSSQISSALALERERITAQMRSLRIDKMSRAVRLAVHRVKSFSVADDADLTEQLEGLRQRIGMGSERFP